MAEGTSLLRMHTAYTCIVGSNPTVSAKTLSLLVMDCQKTRSLPRKLRVFCFGLSAVVLGVLHLFRAFFGAVPQTLPRACPKNHA